MDEAARTRGAAREAIDDIAPARLREVIDEHVATSSMIPGVLTLLAGSVVDGATDPAHRPADPADLEHRAAGVQLIYEGLRLTRTLVHDSPWTADAPPNAAADLDVLAADVLVARGFHLLARTEAAGQAVETVRAFGREQTEPGAARGLEANVFELAAIAGASSVAGDPPLGLRQYVVGLANNFGEPPLPAAVDGLPETIEEVMGRVTVDPPAEEPARTTGVTDP